MSTNLTPINRPVGLADQVYKTLREYLGSHVIRPGQPLQEATLALRLGVSRTPVREALARLLSEGLIAVEGRSFMVPILSDADVDEIYQLRGILEPAALALVAQVGAESVALQELADALAQAQAADAANDSEAFSDANARFHQTWQAQVHNSRLNRAIDLYAGHVRYLRVLTLGSVPARKAALTGMRNILAALRKRDPAAAQRVMSEHLETARKFLRLALDEIEREAREDGNVPSA
ncbi:GntR family transcriptional regulator [Rhodoferax sp.]|uniref:GntR family transcriptional regulator n=1 Tax=Rhodoferax sp. TaxID=50421 RepID=UPI00276F53B9|nr:GntR family transcriptional regulator [Rhodoferax sp.]